MKIIVTGSRDWPHEHLVRFELNSLYKHSIDHGSPLTVMHGDCPTGADHMAHAWVWDAINDGWHVEEKALPANWNAYGKAAGPYRNQFMVDDGADMCVAFPYRQSKGTCHCIARAIVAEIPVMVIEDDHDPLKGFYVKGSERWNLVNYYINRGPSYPPGHPVRHMV